MVFTNLIVWIPWLWRYKIKPGREKRHMHDKLENHRDSQKFKKTLTLLLTIFQSVKSTNISIKDREKLKIEDDAFIYGEIDFLSFMFILDKIKPQVGEVFYDLGSGAGKAVFTAALNYDLSRSVGIELLPGLSLKSKELIKEARSIVKLQLASSGDLYSKRIDSIEMINADLLKSDCTDADIIFVNATCFSETTWEKLLEKFMALKTGCRIITTSKTIWNPSFQLLESELELMSWGMNSVYIYKKIS